MKFNLDPTPEDERWHAAALRQTARDRMYRERSYYGPFRGGKFARGLAAIIAVAAAAWRLVSAVFRAVFR